MENPTPEVKTDDAAASEVPGVPGEEGAVKAHFQSARWPSTPFWIAVLAGILVFVVFMATASALFIIIIGVGLAFFLVPAVDWLEQRGMGRTLASILCVGGALAVTILLLGAIAVILVEQGVKFVQDLPVGEIQTLVQQAGQEGIHEFRLGVPEIRHPCRAPPR